MNQKLQWRGKCAIFGIPRRQTSVVASFNFYQIPPYRFLYQWCGAIFKTTLLRFQLWSSWFSYFS